MRSDPRGIGGIPPLVTSRPTRDTPLLKRACHTFSRFNMAQRHRLRLLGLGPEMPAFQDKCFICQSNLDIRTVLGCHMMPCCGKFIHQRCFRKARQTSFQCGHCRLMPDKDTSSNDTLRANESLDESDDNPLCTSHRRNYGVPLKSNGPGPPLPISGAPLTPTPFINTGRSTGTNNPTTSIPWSGTSCGLTSIRHSSQYCDPC